MPLKTKQESLWRDGAVLVLAVLAVAGRLTPGGISRPPPLVVAESRQSPSVTPLLLGKAVETQPASSPIGKLIAYVSDEAGNDDVWVSDLSGTNRINMTENYAGGDSFPAWSPDGQRIAFYSDRDGGGIYTMTSLGSDVRKIVHVPPSVEYTFSLQWAAKGSIVYTSFDDYGATEVYRVIGSESTPQCLTCFKTPVRGARSGQLSPSGRLLAFVGFSTGLKAYVSVLDLLLGKVTVLENPSDAPHWESDDRLLFLSAREGLSDLWEISVNPRTGSLTGEPTRVTSGLNATQFAVSDAGRRIVAVKQASSSLWVFPTAPDRIDRLSLGTPLTIGSFHDERPRWSNDGREVCFTSNRGGRIQVWRIPSAGGTPTLLPAGAGLGDCPRPSPDGQWLEFDSEGTWSWLMRPDGSGPHQAADWRHEYSLVAKSDWSPLGSRLVSQLRRSDGQARVGIAEVNPATGVVTARRELDATGSGDDNPRWSPDGRSVACETFSGSWNLWILDAERGTCRRVTDLLGNERSAVWQAHPLFLYFIKDQRSLWRIPMSDALTPGGPPSPWLVLPGLRVPARSVDISHDGKRLVVALSKSETDLWLVERK